MESFLDKVSADLYNAYGAEISRLCLVFPSRRARLFFSGSLSKLIERPLWQPECMTMSELIGRYTGKQPSDRLRLLSELYKVYRSHSGKEETFDQFYFWGEMLLHDFDAVDKYLVPAKALFQNLRDQKMLEGDYSFMTAEQIEAVRMFWSSFHPEKYTDLQQSFTRMWEMMYPVYVDFKRELVAQGLAYEGMLYREAAEKEELFLADDPVLSYVFIGFNALNECERSILRRLQTQGKARFYWDRDDYYVQDGRQEAGLFLRKNMKEFPPPDAQVAYDAFVQPKEIEIWPLPSDVLQAKMVPEIIRRNRLHSDKRTAVVLCDESLLIPLVYALPEVVPEVNVTMGYPLVKTSLYTFIEALLLLYKSARMRGEGPVYYHVEVSRLLSHPCTLALCRDAALALQQRMIKDNMLFIPCEEFAADAWLKRMAEYPKNPDIFIGSLCTLIEALEDARQSPEEADPLFLPVLRLAGRELNKFRLALQQSGMEISVPLFFGLLRQVLRGISVPFSGEPLQGVQVMGILETRTLDFEHVILLSAQEGYLPSAREAPSFIPYNLRNGFGLPVKEHHEAMYAYYFYRLLQRAQKVSLLYSTGGDSVQTGEKSRYLLQLAAESPHHIDEHRISLSVKLPKPPSRIVKEKTGACKEQLMRYLTPGSGSYLTPSAVNTYIQCPLQFYFKYVERIKEEQEIAEEADGRGVGSILHMVMEHLYKPFVGQMVQSSGLERILKNQQQIREAVEQAVETVYAPSGGRSKRLFEQGRWLLLADVLCEYVRQILWFDMLQTPFVLKVVEKNVRMLFDRNVCAPVLLGGVIDRAQEREGVLYVVDYKTGKDQRAFESLEVLFSEQRRVQNNAVFQLFWYTMLYMNEEPGKKVLPSIYFIRSLFDTSAATLLFDKSAGKEVDDFAPYAEEFQTLLGQKLAELFDDSKPFTQTVDTEHCEYCAYRPICGK